jgi:hypothetical protein
MGPIFSKAFKKLFENFETRVLMLILGAEEEQQYFTN